MLAGQTALLSVGLVALVWVSQAAVDSRVRRRSVFAARPSTYIDRSDHHSLAQRTTYVGDPRRTRAWFFNWDQRRLIDDYQVLSSPRYTSGIGWPLGSHRCSLPSYQRIGSARINGRCWFVLRDDTEQVNKLVTGKYKNVKLTELERDLAEHNNLRQVLPLRTAALEDAIYLPGWKESR